MSEPTEFAKGGMITGYDGTDDRVMAHFGDWGHTISAEQVRRLNTLRVSAALTSIGGSAQAMAGAMAQERASARLAALGQVKHMTPEQLARLRDAFKPLMAATRRATEAFIAFNEARQEAPTCVHGRALWAKQHRGTGPDKGPIEQRGRR